LTLQRCKVLGSEPAVGCVPQQGAVLFACPGFGWGGVAVQKKPGGHTAGLADPNWPNKQGIRYHGTSYSVWKGAGRGRVITAGEHAGHQAVIELPCIFPCFV